MISNPILADATKVMLCEPIGYKLENMRIKVNDTHIHQVHV